MPYYETALVLDPHLEEEGTAQRIQRYVDLLTEKGARDLREDRRGMRKLAYNIKGKDGEWRTQADYTFLLYTAPPECISEVEAELRLDEDVLRYMTIRHDKELPAIAAPEESEDAAEATTEDNVDADEADDTPDNDEEAESDKDDEEK